MPEHAPETVSMQTLLQDLRYGSRMLANNPGFTTVAVVTLALGIGASTAIFSVANPILFEPLPYPGAARIVMISDTFQGSRTDVTFHTYRELLKRSRSLEAAAVMKPWQPTMTESAEPERLNGQSVSANYFRVLGVPPLLGRAFQASDEGLNGAKVVILSDTLWRRRLLGDRAIVGRQIKLDDNLYTIIGVMPRGFENVLAPSAELWSPLQYDSGNISNPQTREWGHHLRMVGRLRRGVSKDQAKAEFDTIGRAPVPEFPRPRWASLANGLIVDSLQDDVTRGVKPALLAVLGAATLVLAIACVNVTNLLLARGARRHREFAMRAALGADRYRLARQLLTESLLLAILGGACGILVAEFGVSALVALSPPWLPRAGAISINGTVFVFAFAISTLIGVAVGLIPALHTSPSDLCVGLRQSSRHTAGGHQLTRRTLVVAEVALAFVLLVSAGLLLRSLEHLFAVDLGFNPSHLLTMQVQTSGHRFDDDNARLRFFARALEAVRHVRGVAAAAFTSQLPLSGDLDEYGAHFEGDDIEKSYAVFRYAVSPGYLETMGMPLRHGRLLEAHDVAGAPPVLLISESLAKHKFHGQDPIGKRLRVGGLPNAPWYTIVGVVGDVRQTSLAMSQSDAVYITTTQWHWVDDVLSLAVRTHSDTAALGPAIRKAIWSVDKDQPIARVATMEDLLAATAAQRRFALTLFEVFGIAALVLAAIGIYGLLSGSVTERTHELGIRSALGARPDEILALVLRQGMVLTALGVVIGLIGAAAASRALLALLFGLSGLDPVTYLGVIMLMLGVSLLACYLPARRATKVDPVVALRDE